MLPNRLSLGVALALSAAAPLAAQQVTRSDFAVGVTAANVGHPSFGAAHGLAVRYALPSRTDAYTFRLGWDRVRGTQARTYDACRGDFGSYGDVCGPIALREDATLTTGYVGVGMRALRRARLTLDATFDARIGGAGIAIRENGEQWGSDGMEVVVGADAGGELTVMPVRRVPFGLTLGAAYGILKNPFVEIATDGGGSRLDDAFGVLRAHVALVWRPSARTSRILAR